MSQHGPCEKHGPCWGRTQRRAEGAARESPRATAMALLQRMRD